MRRGTSRRWPRCRLVQVTHGFNDFLMLSSLFSPCLACWQAFSNWAVGQTRGEKPALHFGAVTQFDIFNSPRRTAQSLEIA